MQWLAFDDVPRSKLIEDGCAVGVLNHKSGLDGHAGRSIRNAKGKVIRTRLRVGGCPLELAGVGVEIGTARQQRTEVRELVPFEVGGLQAEPQGIAFRKDVISDGLERRSRVRRFNGDAESARNGVDAIAHRQRDARINPGLIERRRPFKNVSRHIEGRTGRQLICPLRQRIAVRI